MHTVGAQQKRRDRLFLSASPPRALPAAAPASPGAPGAPPGGGRGQAGRPSPPRRSQPSWERLTRNQTKCSVKSAWWSVPGCHGNRGVWNPSERKGNSALHQRVAFSLSNGGSWGGEWGQRRKTPVFPALQCWHSWVALPHPPIQRRFGLPWVTPSCLRVCFISEALQSLLSPGCEEGPEH